MKNENQQILETAKIPLNSSVLRPAAPIYRSFPQNSPLKILKPGHIQTGQVSS